MTRSKWMYVFAALLPISSSGCIMRVFTGHKVWTEPVTEQRSFDATATETLKIKTHNGSVRFTGQPSGEATVTITKKAGGSSMEDAENALAAIEVFIEPAGDSSQRIGWRWDGIRRMTWGAMVSFDISAPARLRIDAETHNGSVRIGGAESDISAVTHNGSLDVGTSGGEVFAKTHNGPVEVDAAGAKLHAETHNGRVVATYAGDEVTLISHNGRIVAKLDGCASLDGRILTHNGVVEVTVGEQTSANLNCSTHNGRIHCDVPIQGGKKTRRHLSGTIGSGGGDLDITTHNGAVRIKRNDG